MKTVAQTKTVGLFRRKRIMFGKIKKLYFVGIGGAGMSGVKRTSIGARNGSSTSATSDAGSHSDLRTDQLTAYSVSVAASSDLPATIESYAACEAASGFQSARAAIRGAG